jgi:hypothetical protein
LIPAEELPSLEWATMQKSRRKVTNHRDWRRYSSFQKAEIFNTSLCRVRNNPIKTYCKLLQVVLTFLLILSTAICCVKRKNFSRYILEDSQIKKDHE